MFLWLCRSFHSLIYFICLNILFYFILSHRLLQLILWQCLFNTRLLSWRLIPHAIEMSWLKERLITIVFLQHSPNKQIDSRRVSKRGISINRDQQNPIQQNPSSNPVKYNRTTCPSNPDLWSKAKGSEENYLRKKRKPSQNMGSRH